MDDRTLLPGWDTLDDAVDDAAPGRGTATNDREPAPAPNGGLPQAPGTFGLRILAVSDVARAIRDAVRGDPRLADVWVEGEVGRVTVSSAGHAYFTIKDARSTLNCVWFHDDRQRSVFQPQAGLRIVVHGRIDLFEQQGAVQLYVESIQPAGFGDLAIQFEALKARLAAEGLFDPGRKRPLPTRPATIAVITSPTGVVWHDIATVLTRRWPLTEVLLVPCKVQGADSAESIVRAFGRLERWLVQARRDGAQPVPQLTILARGGGSLEDLWSFNDERVVRSVVGHSLPVVCGVGHEVDVTLADFAADVRAATPSAAAELVVPDRGDWMASFRRAGDRTLAAVNRVLDATRRELLAERRALDRLDPRAQLAADRERAGLLLDRAIRAADRATTARRSGLERLAAAAPGPVLGRLAAARAVLDTTAAALSVLDPQSTLERGYAIVRREADGRILRDPDEAPAGTALAIRLASGELAATAAER
ncbi:MAG: exodeoxyribonuclease VII large subunit [Chloroflexota bacterium]